MKKNMNASEYGSIAILGGRLIDPAQKIDAPMDILLADGRVAEVAAPGKLSGQGDQTIKARGLVVAPGLIDLHVHLREPGQSYKETIATGTAAAAAGGFTSVCAMPNTDPVNDSAEITRWMLDRERGAVVNVFPIAAATVGSAGEKVSDYAALREAGAVAVSDDGKPILEDRTMQEALEAAKAAGFVVIQHAEDTRLTQGRPMNEGAMSFRLGLRGQPSEGEAAIVRRDIALAEKTGTRLHIAHISTTAALDAVREAKSRGVSVTCEVTPHHLLFTEENVAGYDTRYKMNPPLRTRADRQALLAGVIDGTIDSIATDHAPHAYYEKEVEFERAAYGITGLEVVLGIALSRLHRDEKVPLSRIVELMSSNAARIVSLKGRGTLAQGSHADVTIFDPKKRWTYDVSRTRSFSKNCPYHGMALSGRVEYTIVGGRVVYGAKG